MSKRFGRNQRRRAREEMARLSQALEMSEGLARHLGEEKRRVEDEIDDAKRFALPFSAAFAPETMQMAGPRTDRVEVYERQNFSFDEMPSIDKMTIQRLPLRMLLAKAESDQFRRALHCRVKFGDGTWAYGITEQAMQAMPKRRLVELIATSIAQQIAKDLGA